MNKYSLYIYYNLLRNKKFCFFRDKKIYFIFLSKLNRIWYLKQIRFRRPLYLIKYKYLYLINKLTVLVLFLKTNTRILNVIFRQIKSFIVFLFILFLKCRFITENIFIKLYKW